MARDEIKYKGPPPKGEPLKLPDGRLVCGSKRRGTNFICQKGPAKDKSGAFINGRCDGHGGKEDSGRPRKKYDRLSPAMLKEIEFQLTTPDPYSLDEEIAIISHRLEATAKEAEGKTYPDYVKLSKLVDRYILKQEKPKLEEIFRIIKEGNVAATRWAEWDRLTERKKGLTESMFKRGVWAKHYMHRNKLKRIIVETASVIDSVLSEEVTNAEVHGRIIGKIVEGLERVFREWDNPGSEKLD